MKTIFRLFESNESKLERYCKGKKNKNNNKNNNCGKDVKKLQKLLKGNEININEITFDGWSPLHLACATGRLEIVECLLNDGKADANIKSIHELMTPLHVSSWNGHLNIVKHLIDKSEARVVDASEFGYTALHYACKNGQLEVCKYICKKGIDVNIINDEDQTALLLAAKHGKIDVVSFLLTIPHIQINKIDLQHCTPLHHACWEGYNDIVILLLQSNAALTIKDVYGRSPLDVCKTPESKNIIKTYLDDAMAIAESKSTKPESIEHVAATEDHIIEQCWELCEINDQQNDPNKPYDDIEEFQMFLQLISVHPHLKVGYLKYKNSKTLLMEAAQNGKATVCKLLLSEGADPMDADINGFTALHLSCLNGQLSIVKLLLKKCQINPDVCNKLNRTPLHCAAQNGHLDIIKLLLDYDANINSKDKNGYNILHFACFHNHEALVEYLLQSTTIDINDTTSSMEMAIDLTSSKQIIGILKLYNKTQKVRFNDTTDLPTAKLDLAKRVVSVSGKAPVLSKNIINSSKLSTGTPSKASTGILSKNQGVNIANTIQGLLYYFY